MELSQKERNALEDLKTQEESCITKYNRYEKEAHDPILKNLFARIAKEEIKHKQSIEDVLNGTVSDCDCNDSSGEEYQPKATYSCNESSAEKKNDCFLATDCIASEKLVSSEYNSDVFVFGNPKIRKLLADIQIEEQNHAEMLWKYKTVNCMA